MAQRKAGGFINPVGSAMSIFPGKTLVQNNKRLITVSYLDVPLEVSKWLGSVGYNPNVSHV